MKMAYRGYAALAIVVLEVSLWSIFLQIGGSSIGILQELFYGFLVGSIVSVAISLGRDGGKGIGSITSRPSIFGIMILAGLFNDVLTQLFLGMGTLGTNPSIGAIVFRSWVIMVAILTPIVLKKKVSAKQMLATLIGFAGIYIILSGGTAMTFNSGQSFYIGLLLAAAVCSTFSILIMNMYNVDTAGAVAIFNVASFAAISAIVLVTHTSIAIAFTLKVVASILFLGAVAYGIGTMLYYYAVKMLGPLITGNSILAVPFLTIAFSFVMIGTPIKPYYLIAALLAAAGIVMQRRYSSVSERVSFDKKRSPKIFDVTGAFSANKGEVGRKISNGEKALAMIIGNNEFEEGIHSQIFEKRRCIAFTNVEPHACVNPEEIEFVNGALKLNENGVVLIGIGSPSELEGSFKEFGAADRI